MRHTIGVVLLGLGLLLLCATWGNGDLVALQSMSQPVVAEMPEWQRWLAYVFVALFIGMGTWLLVFQPRVQHLPRRNKFSWEKN